MNKTISIAGNTHSLFAHTSVILAMHVFHRWKACKFHVERPELEWNPEAFYTETTVWCDDGLGPEKSTLCPSGHSPFFFYANALCVCNLHLICLLLEPYCLYTNQCSLYTPSTLRNNNKSQKISHKFTWNRVIMYSELCFKQRLNRTSMISE